jgi:DNA-binding NtrC family response regulator
MRPQLALAWSAPQGGGNDEDENEAGTAGRRRIGGDPRGKPTVLVVEDEFLIRLAVCDYLRECGYRVLEASRVDEAQAVLAAGEDVRIVFSDVHLAGDATGFTLAQWVREHYPDIRIILTSGVSRTARDAAALCAESRAEHLFLNKPYAFESLASHIERLLAAAGQRRG